MIPRARLLLGVRPCAHGLLKPRRLTQYTIPSRSHAPKRASTPPTLSNINPTIFTNDLVRAVVSGLLAGLSVFLLGHLFAEYCYVLRWTAGPSMLPTFSIYGDVALISKFSRRGAGVAVGDIVSFQHPMNRAERAVKRIVGMPGDFVMRDTPGKDGEGWMVQVPEGHCWVTGDNLEWSRDSRMFGPLPLALIRGKVLAKITPGWPPSVVWFKGEGELRLVKKGKGSRV